MGSLYVAERTVQYPQYIILTPPGLVEVRRLGRAVGRVRSVRVTGCGALLGHGSEGLFLPFPIFYYMYAWEGRGK